MATHLQIRDGKLIPLENTYVRKESPYIIFTLANGSEIKEYYNYGEVALDVAYDAYAALLSYNPTTASTGSSPYSFTILDSGTGLPVTISVTNGVLAVDNGTTLSSISLIDNGNNLPSTIKVVNGVLSVDQ